MDTDSLTRDAYRALILHSGQISDLLRAEIGSAAARYQVEDAYLGAMHRALSELAEDPLDYLDNRHLLDTVDPDTFASQVSALAHEIGSVMETPLEERGPRGDRAFE